ncbi:MAG: helix-turn-helix transcriptional regulator [Sphingomonadaceae bacterium]
MAGNSSNRLGDYLRDRRARLDPAAFGFSTKRRRTPGLRREEVAMRSNISATWYTWLEQGRGGVPSPDVLDRLATGLMLTEAERDHIFMLALGHLPEVHYRPPDAIAPRLQKILDAFSISPAIIKTATWDVIAWNRAAAILLTDYGALPREERNILRLIFLQPKARRANRQWREIARAVVASFRADVARAGAGAEVERLVEELLARSPEFATWWREHEVVSASEGIKRLSLANGKTIAFEFSSFTIDTRPDMAMIVYNPASAADAQLAQEAVAEAADREMAA